MATSFKRDPKMKTTEPSADEVGKGMKKGGHAHKKHMALGGGLPAGRITGASAPELAARMAAARPRGASMMAAPAMARPASGMPVMRKSGGKLEKEIRNEKEELHRVDERLNRHEGMKAGKAHHGLKRGGKAEVDTPGGLLGGIEATRANPKRMTGGIEGPGYKHGGKLHKAMGGKVHKDTVAEEAKTKVVEAKQVKGFNTKTGGLEGTGKNKMAYAKGGSVKPYENTEMQDGAKMPTKKLGTSEIKQRPAGYAHGGHVAMLCKGGESHKAMKKGGSW